MSTDNDRETGVRATIPADIDAPDTVAYGLTFRQLAVLAVAGLAIYTAWTTLHTRLPLPVLIGAVVMVGGLAFAIAVGRRDGLPLDLWLLHAVRHTRTSKALVPGGGQPAPGWVDRTATRMPIPAPLTIPAASISDDGQIALDGDHAVVTALSTVNLSLRTPTEQAGLVDGFGRWLNALSAATQIVVSAQPVDLTRHAHHLTDTAGTLHPALQQACTDHATFLAELAAHRDPLHRQVLVTTRTASGEHHHGARRRADDATRAFTGLGVTARTLDGAALTAALAAAGDPYRPPLPGVANAVITAATTTNNDADTQGSL